MVSFAEYQSGAEKSAKEFGINFVKERLFITRIGTRQTTAEATSKYSRHRKLIINITRRARKDSVVGSLNRSEEVVRRARFEMKGR